MPTPAAVQATIDSLTIASGGSPVSADMFTAHSKDETHFCKVQAEALLAAGKAMNGYFQMERADTRAPEEGEWATAGGRRGRRATVVLPTTSWGDLSAQDAKVMIRKFFDPATKDDLGGYVDRGSHVITGPIPPGYQGYTNTSGTRTFGKVSNMSVVVAHGAKTTWSIITSYPKT